MERIKEEGKTKQKKELKGRIINYFLVVNFYKDLKKGRGEGDEGSTGKTSEKN